MVFSINKLGRAACAGVGLCLAVSCGERVVDNMAVEVSDEPLTFNRDVAPIVFNHCAECHRPGEAAPFALLEYEEVRKRGRQIAETVRDRYMPPWLPDDRNPEFVGDRRLSETQIQRLERWVEQGMAEGDPDDLPPRPEFESGWRLGKPDLIVEMPEPYRLKAEGMDVYRNIVVPIPLDREVWIRSFEFRPDNLRPIHHAFLLIDPGNSSRIKDEADEELGFDGMSPSTEAAMPDGHFLSWQPGRLAKREIPGLAWALKPGSDLVIQMHMNPTGKEESIGGKAGFYFAESKPERHSFKVGITTRLIDIPAGDDQYRVKGRYTLPVDVRVAAVLPHAHYLARTMRGWAVLPDGTRKTLLHIPEWDFNWQGDYQYAEPIYLPKGSRLEMEFIYDNSENNPLNPNHPPVDVEYGEQSTDEMAELWYQVILETEEQRNALSRHFGDYWLSMLEDYLEQKRSLEGLGIEDRVLKGEIFLRESKIAEAAEFFRGALAENPRHEKAHYNMGLVHRMENRLDSALASFLKVLEINPRNSKACGNIGLIYLQLNRLDPARRYLEKALELDPNDPAAQRFLNLLNQSGENGPPSFER